MSDLNITIETVDGTKHETAILPGDMVKFERKFGLSLADLDKSPKMEHLLFLAHAALARAGDADPDFETWMDTVADFETESTAVPLDPPASLSPPSLSALA